MALKDFLTNIANAIRKQKGTTEKINAQDFADKIEGLTTIKKYIDADPSVGHYFYKTQLSDLTGLIDFNDTSNVTSMYNMFLGCIKLTTAPLLDTSKVTSMSYMFKDCNALTTIPLYDTSNVTNMAYMFCLCPKLTKIPLFDTSNVTNMMGMFSDCIKLTTAPLLDTSKVTNMSYMFYGCTALTTIPLYDTSNVTNMNAMVRGCTKLTIIPLIDTSNVTDMAYMFCGCTVLKTVELDLRSVTKTSSLVYNCKSLMNLYLKNIQVSLTIGSSSYGTLLTVDSLIYIIKELRDVDASRTLTMGSTNTAKIANVYVKLIDITDEMRAEDEFIDAKLPCEVCESTDEGAMLITDYALLKQWTIK